MLFGGHSAERTPLGGSSATRRMVIGAGVLPSRSVRVARDLGGASQNALPVGVDDMML
jgi:hypothetical protein